MIAFSKPTFEWIFLLYAGGASNLHFTLWTKTINISTFFAAGTFPVALFCLSFSSRTHLHRRHFQDRKRSTSWFWEHLQSTFKNHLLQQWRLFPRPRGTPFQYFPFHLLPFIFLVFFFQSHFLHLLTSALFSSSSQNLRNNVIIPLADQSGMACLGPMGNPDPIDIINLETSRIPFKSSNMNLDFFWSETVGEFPTSNILKKNLAGYLQG